MGSTLTSASKKLERPCTKKMEKTAKNIDRSMQPKMKMTNEQIVIELKAVCALITSGKATGQDKGRWMENLVQERLDLLDAYSLEEK